jgi:acetyltransferase-like isoleucine patch superfamily enzyme
MGIKGKVLKAMQNPASAVSYLLSFYKGYYYRCLYFMLGKKVTIGKNFKVRGRLKIRGPGKVTFGDNVNIDMLVTPYTQSEDAEIIIGNGVFLNGTRFSCVNKITIKDDCILGECRIIDCDFHGIHPDYRHIGMSSPICINENVWVTPDCTILKGVEIGSGATITPNSVVSTKVPSNCLFGGNPAVFIRKVK